MTLSFGDSGEPVKALQRGLNRLGSLLLVDGKFGGETRAVIPDARTSLHLTASSDADDALQQALAALADPFPWLTVAGVSFIGRAEVGGPLAYQRRYARPTWPSPKSGVTIGIGYDLQFAPAPEIRADWAGAVPADALERLVAVSGSVGSEERLAQVKDVNVPLQAAVGVFISRSLPRFVTETRTIYPQVDSLPPARRTALISLVYNRGDRLTDIDADKQDRLEMRHIQELLAAGDLDPVADQLDAMARLWNPSELSGLIERRHREATLWRSGFSALSLD